MGGILKVPKVMVTLILAGTLFVGFAGGSLPTINSALAACAAKASSIDVEPKQVFPSNSFEVRGEGFGKLVECDDTGTPGDEDIGGARFEPRKNISIELRQGSQTWELTTVDADQDLAFDEELKVPAGVGSGKAIVTAKGTQGPVKESILVVKSATSGSLAQPKDGGLPLPPPAYEVKPNGDLAIDGAVILAGGCEQVTVSSSEDFPSLTDKQFQDVAAQCAELGSSTPTGKQYAEDDATDEVAGLPDTGGPMMLMPIAGLVMVIGIGGLLLGRRLS